MLVKFLKIVSSVCSHLKPILPNFGVTIVTSAIIAIITITIQGAHEKPDIRILGALPIHFYEELSINDHKYTIHKLAFILKVENKSPTDTIALAALIEGYIHLDPMIGELYLPDNQVDGKDCNLVAEKVKDAIQKVKVSGEIRKDFNVISKYAVSYIGVILPFPKQGAVDLIPNSVSLNGNYEEVDIPSTQPAVYQLLKIRSINDFPKGLCDEFYDGNLKIYLFAGLEKIFVDPQTIKKNLKSLSKKSWEQLSLALMYENPEDSFPPKANNK
jgi:hypothetical protein